jgi:uncharacterized membrane protein YbhN (UPF0104 family)
MVAPVRPEIASVGGTIREFAQSAGQFFKTLGELQPLYLFIGLACFALYILFRSRAIFNAVRAAYPESTIPWRRVWGAYVAAYGLNGIVPAAGGNVVQVVLTKTSIEDSSYPTVTSALCVPALFDIAVASCLLVYAFTNAHFPGLKDFGGLESFDISFLASNPSATLFLITVSGIAGIAGFAFLSRRIALLWVRLHQGWAILRDRRRYVTSMLVPQTIGWVFRFSAYYAMLAAFHVGATVENAALVLAVQVVAAIVPFTPGGAGVQQALPRRRRFGLSCAHGLRAKCCGCTEAFQASRAGSIPVARLHGSHGEWRSLVAHPAGGRAVAGSNPVSPIEEVSLQMRASHLLPTATTVLVI